ncbi:MAG TPA: transcription elongation factor GreA [Firmicutes bacterium]|nr:transcription elongation factor GreA [Bacillota bacterium]
MKEKQQHLTLEGIKKFQDELEFLTQVKMEEIKEKLQEARAQGDLSENAEYDAAREEQAIVYERIQELQFILKNAVVIESDETSDIINIGSTVTYKNDESTEKETFKIVGSAEANPFDNKISNESPIAQALLGKRQGESVNVSTPKGIITVSIIEVQ